MADYPAQLYTTVVQTDKGSRLIVTIRHAGTTLTIPLIQADAITWGKQIVDNAEKHMTSLIVPGPLNIPAPGPQQQRPGQNGAGGSL
jgi:hypothetical protein